MKLIFNSVEEVISFVGRMGQFKPYTDKFGDETNTPQVYKKFPCSNWYLPKGTHVLLKRFKFGNEDTYRLYYPTPVILNKNCDCSTNFWFTDIPSRYVGYIAPGSYSLRADLNDTTLMSRCLSSFGDIFRNALGERQLPVYDNKKWEEHPRFDIANESSLTSTVVSLHGEPGVAAIDLPDHVVKRLNWIMTYYAQNGEQQLNTAFDWDILDPEIVSWMKEHKIYGPYVHENRVDTFDYTSQFMLEFRQGDRIDPDFLERRGNNLIREQNPPLYLPKVIQSETWLNTWIVEEGSHWYYIDWSYTRDTSKFRKIQFFILQCAISRFLKYNDFDKSPHADSHLTWIARQIFPDVLMWLHLERLNDRARFNFGEKEHNGGYIIHIRSVLSSHEWEWLKHSSPVSSAIAVDPTPFYRQTHDANGKEHFLSLEDVISKNMDRDPDAVVFAEALATVAASPVSDTLTMKSLDCEKDTVRTISRCKRTDNGCDVDHYLITEKQVPT